MILFLHMEQTPKTMESAPLVKVITDTELTQRIYDKKTLSIDKRFLPFSEGGVFKYFETESMSRPEKEIVYPIVEIAGEIVGLAKLARDPYKENNFWIKFVSVDKNYSNSGYASKLIEKIFQFAKENGYSLEPSVYSKEGLEKLKNVILRFAKETGVKVIGPHA